MSELFAASASGTLREVFCISMAAVIPATRIRWQRSSSDSGPSVDVEATEAEAVQGIVLPVVGGEDSILHALWERFVDVQEGRIEWEGWGVPCAVADTEGP